MYSIYMDRTERSLNLFRSTNDARFYAYRDYLVKHKEIARVFVTDISGVFKDTRSEHHCMHDFNDQHHLCIERTLISILILFFSSFFLAAYRCVVQEESLWIDGCAREQSICGSGQPSFRQHVSDGSASLSLVSVPVRVDASYEPSLILLSYMFQHLSRYLSLPREALDDKESWEMLFSLGPSPWRRPDCHVAHSRLQCR